ncbi:hypothetical protein OESDEN_07917, partial [Oesophagostomum dentatum]
LRSIYSSYCSNCAQINDTASHATPASVPAVVLLDSNPSTNNMKREGGDMDTWENEPTTAPSTNREFASAPDAILEERVDDLNWTILDFVVNVCDPPDRLTLGAAVLKCMKTVADNVRRQTNTDPSHEQDDNSNFGATPRKRKLPQQGAAGAFTQMQSDEGAGLDSAPGTE